MNDIDPAARPACRRHRLRPTRFGWQYRMQGIRPDRNGYAVVDYPISERPLNQVAIYFDHLAEACDHIDRITEEYLTALLSRQSL